MKKLIVAAAGLMLVGTMVSNASAEAGVSFKGDARARGLYRQDYNLTDSDTSQWQSRVRLIFQGESKGGAYANARVRFADSTWDGTQKTRALGEGSNIYTDWAYVGTPMGPLAIEAGLLPWNLTKFSQWDQRVDGLNVKYVNDMTTVMAFYQKMDEFETDNVNDLVDDDDMDRYGVYVNQKFDGGWAVAGSVQMVNDDQATDRDGVIVLAEVTGAINNVAVLADAHWQEADVALTPDDPWGLYGQAVMPVGAVNLLAGVGTTQDGFVADGDFGPFIMLSDVSSIATAYGIGAFGDTTFAALSPSMKVTEQLTLTGVVAYADIDGNGAYADADSAFEISGSAAYAVTDGATLTAEAGYLDVDGFDEPAIGAGLILVIGF
ncbi:hypothetical protein JWG42_13785 [Desulfoprunum benzoelyticum]|uniref:Porin domain-containing protein n=1 Tax=Desulfoprunum benzoelyticum TaxID=1506996 RepID=A0A840UMY9_9BACT|nr:hypothetical protein [Desulfoprunum benzoelyticum]MBB5347142.1 hypothetical protein [Desulfoprunum benzoelyticum]MBM9531225.1 hypothetical protein [Desulfoprunum benzoelyticum]